MAFYPILLLHLLIAISHLAIVAADEIQLCLGCKDTSSLTEMSSCHAGPDHCSILHEGPEQKLQSNRCHAGTTIMKRYNASADSGIMLSTLAGFTDAACHKEELG